MATIEDQESDMSSPKIKEPSVFYGTPEEDAKDWLARFEEISEVNKWKTSRLPYVKLYLEGTARQWLLVNDFPNWDDFRGKFLNAFKLKNFKFRLETRLRSRRQGLNEPVETYFYDVLNLCRQIEEETGDTITEINKVEYLLNGITSTLLEKLWPLVPDPINVPDPISSHNYIRPSKKDGRVPTSWTLSAITPGLVSREEFDAQASEFKQSINKLRRELEERRFYHKPKLQVKQSRYTSAYNGRAHQPNRLHPNRTTDGKQLQK